MSFYWEGYCTRCHRGVSWDEDADPPETEREAVCHECDRELTYQEGREAGLREAAEIVRQEAAAARLILKRARR